MRVYRTVCRWCHGYYETPNLVALSGWNRLHAECAISAEHNMLISKNNTGGRQGT